MPSVQEILLTDVLPVRFGDVAMGDYDNDRDLDMLLTGARGQASGPNPTTVLYRMLNDTTLLVTIDDQIVEVDAVHVEPSSAVSLPGLWKSSAAWGDFDNDGNLDLALMGVRREGDIVTTIYQQTGRRTFVPRYEAQEPVHSGDLVWGDLDHDGDLDLLVCGMDEDNQPSTTYYRNLLREGGGFAVANSGLDDAAWCTIDLADYELDGDMDVLLTGMDDDGGTFTRIYQNNSYGQFSRLAQSFENFLFASVAWGDIDSDGYMDFLNTGALISPLFFGSGLEYYRYDTTDVKFERVTHRIKGLYPTDPVTGRYFGQISQGDINNDGYQDFVITGAISPVSTISTQLYLSDGTGTFMVKSRDDQFKGGYRGRAVIADYDLDRDLDLVVFGETPNLLEDGTRIRILRNNIITSKLAPIPPDATDANVRGSSVEFTWSPGLDRQTPINALTHNIRIGTSPGASDILSAMANPNNGKRQISAPGNVGTGRKWVIRNLEPGTYYWSIQALDHTYSGSVFSEEKTFTIQ